MRLFKRSEPERGPLWDAVSQAMTEARQYANSHGGDIQLVEVTDDGVVRIKFRGACSFCPLATVTMKVVVEQRLKELVPSIRRVEGA